MGDLIIPPKSKGNTNIKQEWSQGPHEKKEHFSMCKDLNRSVVVNSHNLLGLDFSKYNVKDITYDEAKSWCKLNKPENHQMGNAAIRRLLNLELPNWTGSVTYFDSALLIDLSDEPTISEDGNLTYRLKFTLLVKL